MTSSGIAAPSRTSAWQIVSTPAMSGAENMAYDLATLEKINAANHPPVLRFFRFTPRTVSYGKHQTFEKIRPLIPSGWDSVQRPTGGGIVFHDTDLCLSLCWRHGQAPMPAHLKDHYAWIHNIILEALRPSIETRLADCRDCAATPAPFATRDCFTEPVAFDVLRDRQKIAGGALCRQRDAFLYQGSLQGLPPALLESLLAQQFQRVFQ